MTLPRCLIPIALLISSASSLGACDKLAQTTTSYRFQNEARNDVSWSRIWKDRAEFRCKSSTSGSCKIVLFTSDCPGAGCKTEVVKTYTLPAGKALEVAGLPPGYRHCLSHGDMPVAPTCLKS